MAFNHSNSQGNEARYVYVNYIDGGGDNHMGQNKGVSSVSDHGTGDFTVNFSNSFSATNYAFFQGCSSENTNGNRGANGNNIKIGQETGTGNADHYAQIYYYNGDNNNTFITQKGNGDKDLRMDIRTDGGEQEIMQKGDGEHTGVINLQGSYHTDITLIQQGNTAQSYSLTQNCQTSGGCSVSVTQGN